VPPQPEQIMDFESLAPLLFPPCLDLLLSLFEEAVERGTRP